MSWQLKIAKKVLKQMKRVPQKDAQRLLLVFEELSNNPYRGDIEKIEGEENTWRRRIGDYRIIYELLPKQRFISVVDVRRRTTTTYRKRR